jgi:sterol desaturase/sphingolipid hydroxylase (fatty acid hydroxylase superfamily)
VDVEAYDKNFATKLAIWDRLFGTAYLPAGRKPSGYGLSDVAFPDGYWRQTFFAFRRHRQAAVSETHVAFPRT